jgi:hypothetical protein
MGGSASVVDVRPVRGIEQHGHLRPERSNRSGAMSLAELFAQSMPSRSPSKASPAIREVACVRLHGLAVARIRPSPRSGAAGSGRDRR